jgi:hypothetical protein
MRLRAPQVTLFLAASLALLSLSAGASAQQTPPDVVKLRDGSMFRGTIAELVAHDHVDIVLSSGQTRRFPLADVTYAGPSAASTAAPPSPPPPPPPPPPPSGAPQPLVGMRGPRAELRLEANDSDVEFHVRTGTAQLQGVGWGGRNSYSFVGQEAVYSTICAAPCEASLPTGSHHIGLSHNGKGVIEAEEPVVITGPGTLRGTYTSHMGLRVAGLLLEIGSVVAGSVIVYESIKTNTVCPGEGGGCYQQAKIDGGEMAAGFGVAIVGSLLGTVLMFQHDTADISFVPMSPVATSGSKELASLRTPGPAPQGMSLQVRF